MRESLKAPEKAPANWPVLMATLTGTARALYLAVELLLALRFGLLAPMPVVIRLESRIVV